MENLTSTAYDDVFKTLLVDCTQLVIPLINEIFDEHYIGDEAITFSNNELFIHATDNSTKEKITDSCFTIHSTVDKRYHLECQSTPDGSMCVRMFEYDSQIALKHGDIESYVLTLTFPHSAVLYLRHTASTPDFMTVQIKTPGTDAEYQIPIVKTQYYTLDEIFGKKLLFLIPFYIFCYEKQFPAYNTDEEKLEALKKEFFKIRSCLDSLCEDGQISEYEKCSIIQLSEIVIQKIAHNYEQVRKGVCATMGGNVLDYEAKRILNRGIDEGRRLGEIEGRRDGLRLGEIVGRRDGLREGKIEGQREGKIEALVSLIKDGLLSVNEAAKRLDMDEAELQKYL